MAVQPCLCFTCFPPSAVQPRPWFHMHKKQLFSNAWPIPILLKSEEAFQVKAGNTRSIINPFQPFRSFPSQDTDCRGVQNLTKFKRLWVCNLVHAIRLTDWTIRKELKAELQTVWNWPSTITEQKKASNWRLTPPSRKRMPLFWPPWVSNRKKTWISGTVIINPYTLIFNLVGVFRAEWSEGHMV